ncbi:hypothetical protein ACFPRL_30915 [Pseudoclavibacter helvolus]
MHLDAAGGQRDSDGQAHNGGGVVAEVGERGVEEHSLQWVHGGDLRSLRAGTRGRSTPLRPDRVRRVSAADVAGGAA